METEREAHASRSPANMLHAVIMAGGTGTRFWPLSRAARPKQLLDFGGGQTTIQATAQRLGALVPSERTWIITNRSLVEPIAEQLPQLQRQKIVGEPCKRDTAPAIGLAATLLLAEDADATMVMMPADHLIEPAAALQSAIEQAASIVDERPETLVTFGIKPTYPAESFGYVERGGGIEDGGQGTESKGRRAAAFQVKRFREKPARSVAEQYLASGTFYWNSGIFVWKARTILAAIERFEPEMGQRLAAIGAAAGTPEFPSVLDLQFTGIRGKSIDYAVMEHYEPVVVIEAPFTWDDVGSWQALSRSLRTDASGNTIVGKHIGVRTSGSIVRTDGEHLVATLGLKDTIVIHTPDATLVANKHDEEAIREIVKELEARSWREYL